MSLVLIRVSGSNRQVDVPVTAVCREEAGGKGLGNVAISAERVTTTRTPMARK